jgi:hypothetical protein
MPAEARPVVHDPFGSLNAASNHSGLTPYQIMHACLLGRIRFRAEVGKSIAYSLGDARQLADERSGKPAE